MTALHWTGCDLSMSDHGEVNDPKETLEIQNVVASTAIDQELNLESVAIDLEGADFDPDKFPGVVYRIQDPHAAALIFRSGKIVCTGAESVPAVHQALEIVFECSIENGWQRNFVWIIPDRTDRAGRCQTSLGTHDSF